MAARIDRGLAEAPADLAVENAVNPEIALVAKARGGDTDSFSALVELYQERAVRAAWAVVGNLEDARDLAQEAFVKAYESLARFDGRSAFYTWLYRILLNTCKDFLRKKKIRGTFSFWLGDDEEGGPGLDPADPSRNARQETDSRLIGGAALEALGRLPQRQKDVFMMRYLEGMELSQIAQVAGTSVGAVKANLWHAAQKMRKWLEPFWEEAV